MITIFSSGMGIAYAWFLSETGYAHRFMLFLSQELSVGDHVQNILFYGILIFLFWVDVHLVGLKQKKVQ